MEITSSVIKMLIFACLLFLSSSTAYAMGPSRGDEIPPAKPGDTRLEKITVNSVLDDPARFEGKEIVLEGAFLGWGGKCAGTPPKTRSDWVLEDETGCIYVSGKMPSGLSAAHPKGERLVIRGTIKTGKGGKPFVEALEVRQVPTLPR